MNSFKRKFLYLAGTLFLNFVITTFVGCTKAAPKIQSLGKTVNSFDFASQSQSLQSLDPNTNSFTVNGTCSKDVDFIQINHPVLKEWTDAANIVETTSDLNCSDGNFKLVINTVTGPFAFTRDQSYSGSLEIRMITKFKEIDIKRVELNYSVSPNQPKVSLVVVNNKTEVTEGTQGSFQIKFVIDNSFAYHTKDIKGTFRIDGDVTNSDYSVAGTSFLISANQIESQPITITTLKDNLFELDENLIISIDTLKEAVKDTNFQATIVVHNADRAPTISVPANLGIIEGDQSGDVVVTVSLTSAAGLPISFHAQTNDGNSDSTYYEAINSDFIIPAGLTSINIPVKAKDPDNTALSGKYFKLDISNINPVGINAGITSTQINITDNDGPNIISLNTAAGKNSLTENDGSTISVLVSLTKIPDIGKDVSVDLVFSGAASSSSDYVTNPAINTNKIHLVFSSSDAVSKTVIINTLNDTEFEIIKNIKLDLANPSANASIFSGSQPGIDITLADDDISDFNILTLKGSLNTSGVGINNGVANSKIYGNLANITWEAISGATSIDIDIQQSGSTVSNCHKSGLPGSTTNFNYIGIDCELNSGQSYTAKVTASNSYNLISKSINFSTNSAPTALVFSKKLVMDGFDLTVNPNSLASDADGDSLFVSATARTNGSKSVTCSVDANRSLKISVINSSFVGDTTCSTTVSDGNGAAVTVPVVVFVVPKNSWLGTNSNSLTDSNNWCTGLDSTRSSCTTSTGLDFSNFSLNLFVNDLCDRLVISNCLMPLLSAGQDKNNLNSILINSLNLSKLKLKLEDNTALNIKSLVQNGGEINISNNNGNLNISDSITQSANGKITDGNLNLVFSTTGSQNFDFNGINSVDVFSFNKASNTAAISGIINLNYLYNLGGTLNSNSSIVFNVYKNIYVSSGKMEGGTINILGENNQTLYYPNSICEVKNTTKGFVNNLTVNKSGGLLSQDSTANQYNSCSFWVQGNIDLQSSATTVDTSIRFRVLGSVDSSIRWPQTLKWFKVNKDQNKSITLKSDVIVPESNKFENKSGLIKSEDESSFVIKVLGTNVILWPPPPNP